MSQSVISLHLIPIDFPYNRPCLLLYKLTAFHSTLLCHPIPVFIEPTRWTPIQPNFPTWNADEPSTLIAERCTRNRINSAIFVSSEGKGFDSIEFLRRYGSQSVLCRKAKSAENITSSEQKVGLPVANISQFQLGVQ